jgi:hypothetical protein
VHWEANHIRRGLQTAQNMLITCYRIELDKLSIYETITYSILKMCCWLCMRFVSNLFDVCIFPLLHCCWLCEKNEWMGKWMWYAIGHNCRSPQPRCPKQAYNKLKCYELAIVNGKQSIS